MGMGMGWDGDGVRGCMFLPSLASRWIKSCSGGLGVSRLWYELRLGGRVCTDALYVPGLLVAPLTVHALLVCVLVLRSSLA